jgi:hypothetical protein
MSGNGRAVLLVLGASAGCAAGARAAGPTVVLQRDHLGRHLWQLVAWEQGGQLGLGVDGASQKAQYSAGVGFSASPSAGFWMAGLGPGNSNFCYGPAPASAKYAVLTAPAYLAIVVPTRPIPNKDGLPGGRFFVVGPCPVAASLRVTLRDAAGRRVAFAAF